MKIVVVVAAMAGLSLGSASAADLARPAPVAVAPATAPAFSWGGLYAGVTAGYGQQKTDWSDPDYWYYGDSYSLKNAGLNLGIYGGYNYMVTPVLLLGIETDLAYQFGSDDATVASEPAYIKSRGNLEGTVRGRVGWAFDRTLIYGTAGLAVGNPSARWYESSGADWRADGARVGYVVGAGAEYALTNQWLIRIEGLYTDYGSFKAKDKTPSDAGDYSYTSDYRQKVSMDAFSIRAGIGYKF